MSNPALDWAVSVSGISATQKLVLLLLANRADKDGKCWPSVTGIADDACLTRRGVQIALNSLVDNGLIERRDGGGRHRTHTYTLRTDRSTPVPVEPGAETANVVRLIKKAETANDVPKRANVVRERANVVRETANDVRPNPKEPKGTHRNPKRDLPGLSVAIPDWLPADAWAEWCAHKGRSWSALGATKAIKALARYREQGHDPRDVIDHCLASNYAGLFPPKHRKPATREWNGAWAFPELAATDGNAAFDIEGWAEEKP